jgi:ligand-binding sensor domain-containing protein
VTAIHSATFLEKKELIKCLVLLNEQTLLIGTNKGNIYRYDFTQSSVLQRISLGNETKQEPIQLTVFATTPKQVHEVNSIAVYGEFVLAALSNGKAYSLQS